VPTYSYACTGCGYRFDAVQTFTEDALTTCQQCSGRLRKLFSSVGVVFKGSGFYRTDSREPAKNSASGSVKTSSPAGSGGSDASGSGTTDTPATSGSKPDPAKSKTAATAST
jgi:putative FmdB family regulatory protein